jgi:hypothetical protein
MIKLIRTTVLVATIAIVGLVCVGCACCGPGVAATPGEDRPCAEGWFSNDNGLVDDFYVGCGPFGTYYGYWPNAGHRGRAYQEAAADAR